MAALDENDFQCWVWRIIIQIPVHSFLLHSCFFFFFGCPKRVGFVDINYKNGIFLCDFFFFFVIQSFVWFWWETWCEVSLSECQSDNNFFFSLSLSLCFGFEDGWMDGWGIEFCHTLTLICPQFFFLLFTACTLLYQQLFSFISFFGSGSIFDFWICSKIQFFLFSFFLFYKVQANL